VHRAPLTQPGHHHLRHQGHHQLDVHGLAEQLAGVCQVGHPGPPAQVGAAQPVHLHGQRHPLGGQLGKLRCHRGPGTGQDAQYAPQRRGERQRDLHERRAGQRRRVRAVLGQRDRAAAVAVVDLHRDAVGPQHLA
jgi:hypothetical protein